VKLHKTQVAAEAAVGQGWNIKRFF